MSRAWRSLRVRLAVTGFLAIYLPVLLLFGVTVYTEYETTTELDNGVEITTDSWVSWSPWITGTVLALAPAAALLAWWWAGRAVAPYSAMHERLQHAADAQRRLIEETSHELRIPLSVLATNAEVLLAHPAPTLSVYREGLERSGRAATRLRAVIDELLVDARGRARTIDRQPADLVALVRAVVDDAQVVAGSRGVSVLLTAPARLVGAVDEATVRRAVANLLDNAVRHAPSASSVEVAVEDRGAELAVVVADHGPGIPAAHLPHVFEPFWHAPLNGDPASAADGAPATTPGAAATFDTAAGTSSRTGTDSTRAPGTGTTSASDTGARTGTGLGLPIARQIALAHGGDVTIAGPGPGCVVTLTLRR